MRPDEFRCHRSAQVRIAKDQLLPKTKKIVLKKASGPHIEDAIESSLLQAICHK